MMMMMKHWFYELLLQLSRKKERKKERLTDVVSFFLYSLVDHLSGRVNISQPAEEEENGRRKNHRHLLLHCISLPLRRFLRMPSTKKKKRKRKNFFFLFLSINYHRAVIPRVHFRCFAAIVAWAGSAMALHLMHIKTRIEEEESANVLAIGYAYCSYNNTPFPSIRLGRAGLYDRPCPPEENGAFFFCSPRTIESSEEIASSSWRCFQFNFFFWPGYCINPTTSSPFSRQKDSTVVASL